MKLRWAILKLQFTLWRMFPRFEAPLYHQVRLKKRSGPFGSTYWTYVNRVKTKHGIEARVLGTVYQWTFQEALQEAALQAAEIQGMTKLPEPKPDPTPVYDLHGRTNVPTQNGMQIKCNCGWFGQVVTCHPFVKGCETCEAAETEYLRHKYPEGCEVCKQFPAAGDGVVTQHISDVGHPVTLAVHCRNCRRLYLTPAGMRRKQEAQESD